MSPRPKRTVFACCDRYESPEKHLALEGHGFEQPEIRLQRRAVINDVELMGRLVRGAHGAFVDVIRVLKRGDKFWDFRGRKLNHEIEIVRAAGNAPGVAGHGTGEHIGDAGAVQPPQTIDEEFLLGHGRLASSSRCRSRPFTSSSLAPGCWRRIPTRAISQ